MNTKFLSRLVQYCLIVVVLVSFFILARSFHGVEETFSKFPEGLYLSIALIFIIGFGTRKFSKKVFIPSFVLAILMGVALQPLFSSLTHDYVVLSVVNEFLAALILFGSGVEMPWQRFKKHFGPVASLASFGILVSVILFALVVEFLTNLAGIEIPAYSLLLLGAVLSSVDVSAVTPILKNLHFREHKIQDIVIAESAVNDVTGTIVTRFFLVVALAATQQTGSVIQTFLPLLQRHHFDTFALEIIWGVIVGVVGSKILQKWYNPNTGDRENPALFFAIPIFCYALGGLLGGSGYLAAFVAGLLYQSNTSTKNVAHFFETFNSYLVIPVIFVLLGAVVPIDALVKTANIGIAAALLFMLVVRPLVVVTSLIPWLIGKNRQFTIKEYVFFSVMRETGGIAAVLLLIIASQGIAGIDYILGIGFWVIFMTLMIEPPLTPWLTTKLGLAIPIEQKK